MIYSAYRVFAENVFCKIGLGSTHQNGRNRKHFFVCGENSTLILIFLCGLVGLGPANFPDIPQIFLSVEYLC